MQALDLLRYRHEGAPVNVERHLEYVAEAELAARAASEAVDLACLGKHHGMHVAARSVSQFELFQCLIFNTRSETSNAVIMEKVLEYYYLR